MRMRQEKQVFMRPVYIASSKCLIKTNIIIKVNIANGEGHFQSETKGRTEERRLATATKWMMRVVDNIAGRKL